MNIIAYGPDVDFNPEIYLSTPQQQSVMQLHLIKMDEREMYKQLHTKSIIQPLKQRILLGRQLSKGVYLFFLLILTKH